MTEPKSNSDPTREEECQCEEGSHWFLQGEDGAQFCDEMQRLFEESQDCSQYQVALYMADQYVGG